MEDKNKNFRVIGETENWWLFDREKTTGNWKNLKLVLKDENVRKRNFWFGWNTEQKRVSVVADTKLMQEHYPELYDEVLAKLTPPELKIVG